MKNHHTQRIQKIIKGKPRWLTRWGMTLLFCFFCVLFILTALIPYQEVAKINAQITGINEAQPVSLIASPEFLISCKIQSTGEMLKIRAGQTVTVRLSRPKRKECRIIGKIKRLYRGDSDNETVTLVISASTTDASAGGQLSLKPSDAVHLDIFIGDTILFKQLLESVVSNFQPAKF
jgi:hypothetical protein